MNPRNSVRSRRSVTTITTILCWLLLTCSQKKNDNPLAVSPGGANPIASITQRISAAQGGQIILPNGSYASIAPGTFPTDTTLTLSLLSTMNNQPPDSLIRSVGPSLMLAFGGTVKNSVSKKSLSKRMDSSQTSGIQLVLSFDSTITGFIGSDPIGDVVDLSGNHNFYGPAGTYDSSKNTSSFTVDLSVLNESGSINVGRANFSPSIATFPAPVYGPRLWNGSGWVSFPSNFSPHKKTLVVVHGIMSSVESAYSKCLGDIMAAGGYDQVVGFDYDWTKSADYNGALLASFLDDLKNRNVSQVDLEAHSFGGLVSLSALSKSAMKVNNLITEGTPLSGTPIAAIGNVRNISPWLTSLYNEDVTSMSVITSYIAGSLSKKKNVITGTIIPALCTTLENVYQAELASGSITDLQNGSSVLDQVMAGPQPPNFIRVAGTKDALDSVIDGAVYGGVPNDSWVPTASADGSKFNLPGQPKPIYVDQEHTKLECDPRVISAVGDAVKAHPLTIDTPAVDTTISTGNCTYTLTPQSSSFDSTGGFSAVTVTATGDGCVFSVSSCPDWVETFVDSAGVAFMAAPNLGTSARSGVIAISGKIFTVTQTGKNAYNQDSVIKAGIPANIPTGFYTITVGIVSTNMNILKVPPPFILNNANTAVFCEALVDSMSFMIEGAQMSAEDMDLITDNCTANTVINFTQWAGTSFTLVGALTFNCLCPDPNFPCPQSGVTTFTYTVVKN